MTTRASIGHICILAVAAVTNDGCHRNPHSAHSVTAAPQIEANAAQVANQLDQLQTANARVLQTLSSLQASVRALQAQSTSRTGAQDSVLAGVEKRILDLDPQVRANAAAIGELQKAAADVSTVRQDLDNLRLRTDQLAASTGTLQSDLLAIRSKHLSDSANLVASLVSVDQTVSSLSSQLKTLTDRLVSRTLANRAQAAAKLNAAGRVLDDYVPCELPQANSDALKLQNTELDAEDLLSGIYLLKTKYNIEVDENALIDSLTQKLNQGSAAPLAAAIAELVDAGKIRGTVNQSKDDIKRVATEVLTGTVAGVAGGSPRDVGCQMSVLPWRVTADSFGRHVADQFIAFQVTVRNLNTTQEFVLHNTDVAVDKSRFYAGIDKMIVRNTQNHGNYYDRRNFLVRVLEVAGDIAAGAAPYGSGDTQSGIGVFRAAFIPGMQKVFPDRYISQINALNDLGFSSSTAYKMMIPVKGSAPFVTFLPADIFSTKLSSPCTNEKSTWHYKTWGVDCLHAFAESTYVVVSGVHVTETVNTQTTVTSIDCHAATVGTLDLTKADLTTKTLACALRGTNLEKVSAVRLRNAGETTDPVTVDGVLSLSGGQNSAATVTFQSDELAKLKGTSYAVFLVMGSTKPDSPTALTLSVNATASTKSLTLSLGGDGCSESDCTLTVEGNNMLQAKQALLYNGADKEVAAGDIDKTSTATILKAHFTTLAAITASATYQLLLKNNGTTLVTIPVTVTLIPAINSITPNYYSKASPNVSFQLVGARLSELTSVGLSDGTSNKAMGEYDASKNTLVFKKSDLDQLVTGNEPIKLRVAGKAKDKQTNAISKADFTLKP